MSCCIVMGKVVVTIIILSANTASCLIYTSRCGVGYTSMITDFVPMILINGYYLFPSISGGISTVFTEERLMSVIVTLLLLSTV